MKREGTVWRARSAVCGLLALCAAAWAGGASAAEERPPQRPGSGFSYFNRKIENVPWSVHVLKIDRSRADLEFHTTLAKGATLGLATLTEQLKTLPASLGQPVGAVNGDFWRDGRQPSGDPMGLLIRQGELISAPCERPCFWLDAEGKPHATNVLARFSVTWPDGKTTPLGLNEERTNNSAVLFTGVIGASTKTRGGRELVLECADDGPWVPLRIGRSYNARVRESREAGDSRITADTLVLSLDPELAARVPKMAVGDTLTFGTDTAPGLQDVHTAIGGGPMLVRDGKVGTFAGSQKREPRTAVGWNDKHLFLVVVDGRQSHLSVGMSFAELAGFFVNELGCQHAINLDGGGSATFWVMGQVMNSPCYGHEREMANALVVVRKPRAPEARGNSEGR